MAGEEDSNNNTVAFTGEESIPDDQETRATPDEASVDAAAPPPKKRGRKRKTEKEVRRSERPKKSIRLLNHDYLSDVEEEVKKTKGKRGRKKKCIEQQQMVTSYDLFANFYFIL